MSDVGYCKSCRFWVGLEKCNNPQAKAHKSLKRENDGCSKWESWNTSAILEKLKKQNTEDAQLIIFSTDLSKTPAANVANGIAVSATS